MIDFNTQTLNKPDTTHFKVGHASNHTDILNLRTPGSRK